LIFHRYFALDLRCTDIISYCQPGLYFACSLV